MVKHISTKQLQIDKTNASMVIALVITSFIIVFSLVASRALLCQRGYQARVIAEKKKALAQLKSNNSAATKLVASYQVFLQAPNNIIGGLPTGTGDRDGDNARIVLDALPSKYDFPALATSIDKVLTAKNYKVESISGTDDELNQTSPTANIQPVEMPFQVSVSGTLDTAQGTLDVLQHSIRPIYINKLNFTSNDKGLTLKITAKSYYQPEKTVRITTKVIR